MAICKRAGCGKTLRSDNSKGKCFSGCLSMEAPPFQRAKHLRTVKPGTRLDTPEVAAIEKKLRPAKKVTVPPGKPIKLAPRREVHYSDDPKSDAEKTLEEFQILAKALGKDPKAMLAEIAREWLDAVHGAVAKIDGAESTEPSVAEWKLNKRDGGLPIEHDAEADADDVAEPEAENG